ncbi:MAG: SPOR domain-containing protein, partial [Deltaproteobacteria bacterium]|nr:SPOR domain-containing protein [Deltaproteobacteria bacterium]
TNLKNDGYPAYYITEMSSGEITWYKIRMGSFKDRADAQRALNGLKKYKDKAIIVSNKTSRPDKHKKASKAEVKKELKAKTPAPALRETPSSPEKQGDVGKREKQISELKVEKESLAKKPVIETPVVTHETDTSITQEVKTESPGAVEENMPSVEQKEDKKTLASGEEILSQKDRKGRLESFLNSYCQTYASKDLDKFVSFFAPDATENNIPFRDMLPKYRKNMEKIELSDYRIELIAFSLQADTGTIRIQGKYFTRYLMQEGTWRENSGDISMELTENGNSYLVKRLNYP